MSKRNKQKKPILTFYRQSRVSLKKKKHNHYLLKAKKKFRLIVLLLYIEIGEINT